MVAHPPLTVCHVITRGEAALMPRGRRACPLRSTGCAGAARAHPSPPPPFATVNGGGACLLSRSPLRVPKACGASAAAYTAAVQPHRWHQPGTAPRPTVGEGSAAEAVVPALLLFLSGPSPLRRRGHRRRSGVVPGPGGPFSSRRRRPRRQAETSRRRSFRARRPVQGHCPAGRGLPPLGRRDSRRARRARRLPATL